MLTGLIFIIISFSILPIWIVIGSSVTSGFLGLHCRDSVILSVWNMDCLLFRKQNQVRDKIKTHIINYSKTRETYIAYRKSGYSKKFLEAHRDEITLHKAAKGAFSKLPEGKIPRVKDLNDEFARLLSEKKAAYNEYKKIKKEMRDYQIAKQNVESFYAAQQGWDAEEDLKKKRQQQR